jgi:hypothetical protein
MKRRVLYVENFAKIEKVIPQNLSNEFDIDERAGDTDTARGCCTAATTEKTKENKQRTGDETKEV